MPSPGRKNDQTQTIAVTFRPKDGLTRRHEQLIRKWLDKNADQWEFYEETLNDDPATRHLHGRVLLKDIRRMDKIKDSMAIGLGVIQAEKKVLLRGIKWLYDDWEYAGKDGFLWDREITDEDEWSDKYADPAEKTERKKNAELHHWLDLIKDELCDRTNTQQVERLMGPHFKNNTLELPYLDQLKKKCERIAYMWNLGLDDM
jgi:hypothetical protein